MKETKGLYGNIRVLMPSSDTIIFRTTQERAQWYIDRNLAAFEGQDALRLKFEPKGNGHADNPYFLQDFKNRCVVCGIEAGLSHHHIVPECYRKYFPRHSEASGQWMYDVLLLCRRCHKRYETSAWARKEEIAQDLGVPIGGATNCDEKMTRAIKAAAALERHWTQMPADRRAELEAAIQAQIGRQVVYQEYRMVRKQLQRSVWRIPMGKLVAEKVQFLDAFSIGWREHFIVTMAPQFLPEGWVVGKMIYG